MAAFEMLDRRRSSHGCVPELSSLAKSECAWQQPASSRRAAVTSSGADLGVPRGIEQKDCQGTSYLAIFHGRNTNSGHSALLRALGQQEPVSGRLRDEGGSGGEVTRRAQDPSCPLAR